MHNNFSLRNVRMRPLSGAICVAVTIAVAQGGSAVADGQEATAPANPEAAPSDADSLWTWCRSEVHDTMGGIEGSHLEAHVFIMSRCPFAGRALQEIVPVLQSFPVGTATLKLDMIGTGSSDSSFSSTHGSTEVDGDKLYLCLQQHAQPEEYLNSVMCLAQTLPAHMDIPQDQIVSAAADSCFAATHVSQATQESIYKCRTGEGNEGATGEELLRDSFAIVDEGKIGESPTIFFGAPGLEQDAATVTRLQDMGLTPKSEILYCGDRNANFISEASCYALRTFQDGTALPQEMLTNLNECPQTGIDSEPGCVDSNVEMGNKSAFFFQTFGPIIILCGFCALPCCRSQRLCPRSRRLAPSQDALTGEAGGRPARTVSRGLSVNAISRIPTFVVADGLNSTCTICFEPVCDGETSFSLRCNHRHHVECLRDWVSRKAECPDCRGAINARNLASSGTGERGGNGIRSVSVGDDIAPPPPPSPPPGAPPPLVDDPDDDDAVDASSRTANPMV